MRVLGINAVFRDPAVALVVDGQIVAAAEEERFSRRKHGKPPVAFASWEMDARRWPSWRRSSPARTRWWRPTPGRHMVAAVGAPIVSLFAPVVPASRWCPYDTLLVLLGDQTVHCGSTRARRCPVPGHTHHVVAAVERVGSRGAA